MLVLMGPIIHGPLDACLGHIHGLIFAGKLLVYLACRLCYDIYGIGEGQ